MAALQVLQGNVGDERAIVQLHHSEALLATGAAAQSSDAIICDQLAVGKGLVRVEWPGMRNHREMNGLKLHKQKEGTWTYGQSCRCERLPVPADEGSGWTVEPRCYLSPGERTLMSLKKQTRGLTLAIYSEICSVLCSIGFILQKRQHVFHMWFKAATP